MFTFRELLQAIKCRPGELKHALSVYSRYKDAWEEENEVQQKLSSLDLPTDIRIGAMIKTANAYGIVYNVGTTRYDCRAILNRSEWKKPIDRTVPLEELTFFTIPPGYDGIQEFQGISNRIEIAIARCLINARTAGVI